MRHHLFLVLLAFAPVTAAVLRDVPYASFPRHDPAATSLDIVTVEAAEPRPVVIYVHGGGWWQGDKAAVGEKPAFFTDAGFVFVSINYRLTPAVAFPTHAQDVARAVAWVRRHIADYGGDPDRLILFGHSAGAHLAALVATDRRYLNEQGLRLDALEAAVINDAAAFDLVARADRGGGELRSIYASTFRQDPELWDAGSPERRIGQIEQPPPMAVLYSRGDDPDQINPLRQATAASFVDALNRAGIMAELIDGSAFTHAEINRLFGSADNELGAQVLDFLQRVSGFARLAWRRDLPTGATDPNGERLGGTEITYLTTHQGRLYAGTGSWNEDPTAGPATPARILVKEDADARWRVEHDFPDHVRVGYLGSIALHHDADGQPLAAPVTLLLASPQGLTTTASIWIRDDGGDWQETILQQSMQEPVQNFVRALTVHRDPVTGVEAVFAGVATSAIYRGVYDPDAGLRWDPEPELTGSERCHALAVADGRLYASIGSNNDPNDGDGGLWRRVDGAEPRWEFLWEWTVPAFKNPGLRGLTPVVDPDDANRQVLLAGNEGDGAMLRLDAAATPLAHTELAFGMHFRQAWGDLGGAATLAAYNDCVAGVDPQTDRPVHLIGLFVNHPTVDDGFPYDGAWFLVRQADGGYGWGGIRRDPASGTRLRAIRSFRQAPWGDWYAAGYDAAGGPWYDSAWIYRGQPVSRDLPRHRRISVQLRRAGDGNASKVRCEPGARISPEGDADAAWLHRFAGLPVDQAATLYFDPAVAPVPLPGDG